MKEDKIITFTQKYPGEKEGFFTQEYYCKITERLDELSQIVSNHSYLGEEYAKYHRHYALIDGWTMSEKIVAIRVPGGTVGSIKFDDKYIIQAIHIDTNYVVKTYPEDVNDTINKEFLGMKLDLDSVDKKE